MATKFGVSLSDDVAERVDAQLEYGDSRSEWIEQAILMRLEVENVQDSNDRVKA